MTDSSSTSSRFSTTYLEGLLEELKHGAHQGSTKANYYGIWKKFNEFLIKLDKMPKTWEDRLSLYCAYLITVKKRKSSTVKSYISGIKYILRSDGYEWDEGKMLLNTITKSCKLKNDKLKVRLPIQKGLLELILFRIQRKFETQPYLEAMYVTAFLLQYYGLLRIGEIANSPHSLKAVNVHEAEKEQIPRLLLVLYTSKTHGRDKPPQKIKIFGNKSIEILNEDHTTHSYSMRKQELGKFCPVQWTKRFIHLRGPVKNNDENFFHFRDSSPVSASVFRNMLRETIASFDLDPSIYDTHSFRIGRATDLFKSGVSVDDIKQLGRWKSNAVYKYLKDY